MEKQKKHLPQATSIRQIRKLIGIFNFCRPVMHTLDLLLEPLLAELKKPFYSRMCIEDVQEMCKNLWTQILTNNVSLLRPELRDDHDWNLMVDWSGQGAGYVLFLGQPKEDRVVGINSMRLLTTVGSHLGELSAIRWALKDLKPLTSGEKVVLWTDSFSVVSRLNHQSMSAGASDVRVARLLSWVWENYPLGQRLEINHIPGISNEIADILSRWKKAVTNNNQIADETHPEVNAIEGFGMDRITLVHREAHWGVAGTIR